MKDLLTLLQKGVICGHMMPKQKRFTVSAYMSPLMTLFAPRLAWFLSLCQSDDFVISLTGYIAGLFFVYTSLLIYRFI
jgi:hypothetical protein